MRRAVVNFQSPVLLLSAAILVARLFPAPPLSDPTGHVLPPGVHLMTPGWYLLGAPLFSTWDAVSMLSASRLRGFLIGLALMYAAWRMVVILRKRPLHRPLGAAARELLVAGIAILGLGTFILLGALWQRPMLALAGVPSHTVVADFHSHTNASHDVQGTLVASFDAEANRAWHRKAGFDLAFITDHNTVAGWTGHLGPGRPELCPGMEVSAWKAHIVLLGDTAIVDHSRYDGSLEALLALLHDSDTRYRAISIASMPEYERSHWSRLADLLAAGLGGFEVVNASPKANEMTRPRRDSVIALASAENRLIVGVSDQHGWGATSMVWTLVPLVPPAESQPPGLCGPVLTRLREGGFPATQIIERHRLRPDDWWPLWLTPVGALWESWRSLSWPLTLSWLAWVWGIGLAGVVTRRAPGAKA